VSALHLGLLAALAAGCPAPAEIGQPDADPPAPDAGGSMPDVSVAIDAAPPAPRPDAAGASPAIGADSRPVVSASVAGFQLLVRRREADGRVSAPAPYDLRGISWSPAARGGGKPDLAAFAAAADTDLGLMRAAGINTVKTYSPVDTTVLDRMLAQGILAVITVFEKNGDDYAGVVRALGGHPAVLMWLVGNEWNQNHLFGTCAGDACYARVAEVAADIKRLDPAHPVGTSFAPTAGIPTDSDLRRLEVIDVWGLNVYSQPGFFNRFLDWRALAARVGITRPFFMSEYGADAFDQRRGRPDEAAQAAALRRQTAEIRAQLSARDPALPCLGGTPFEWSDEWWKSGGWNTQDPGGFANQGVAPDGFANEDWWGVVDIDRHPRAAYAALEEQYAR
jgi:hypothetical protein